jgi:tetratricopeptide (TPR) repeat protein
MNNRIRRVKALALAAVFAGCAAWNCVAGAADSDAIGQRIATALNDQDVAAMEAAVDVESLGHSLSRDLGLNQAETKSFVEGLRKGMRRNLEGGMQQFAQKQGVARFMRSASRDGKPYVLVRIEYKGDEGGFDYVEYYLSGSRTVEDWYTHSRGSRASTAMAVVMSSMLRKDGILGALFGVKSLSDADLKSFRDFGNYLAAGDMPNAHRALQRLPESYRQTRDWAMLRANVASYDERAYRAALEYLARNFGADPVVQFMLIDHYYYQQQFDQAYRTILSFENSIGGEDAATNFLKCSTLIAGKRYEEAVKSCRRGIQLEPDFESAYWGVVTAGLESRNAKLALAGLTAYEQAFRMEFDPDKLAQIEQYRELSRTPEFAAWAKPRRN